VVGTRYAAGGGTGDWSSGRVLLSRIATAASRGVLTQNLSDPMSGFFMLRRTVLEATVRDLAGLGFKILLDILTAARQPLRVVEIPYQFRKRFAGETKLNGLVIWEYGMLLAHKKAGRYLSVRFLAFSLVGGLGVLIHMLTLGVALKGWHAGFTAAQSIAALAALIGGFALNNLLTYRDRRLAGWAWLRGLVTFGVACAVGAMANIGLATYLFERHAPWAVAGLAGALVGALWNHAVTQIYAWIWR
jgi:dolichol-phosphate mannosyltransferase